MAREFPENIGSIIDESTHTKTNEAKVWDLALKFLEGRQWMSWDTKYKRWSSAPDPMDGMSRVTVNLLLNIYRNITSRLALAYPSTVVMPASPSSDDIVKAQSSEIALRYYWASASIPATLAKAIDWAATTGTAALHSYYDPDEKVVMTKAYGAYDIFFEPGVREVEDSQWIGIRTIHTREDLKDAYPDKHEIIDGAQGSYTGMRDNVQQAGFNVPKDRVDVYELYWRDGRHAIVAGNSYLFKEDEHAIPVIPIQIIRYTAIPNRLWGLGVIAQLLDLQVLYNKARSQIIHNVETMGNPKWLIPRSAGLAANALTNRPGEKVFYNPAGGPPQQVQPAPIPSYVIDNIARIQSEMGDVAGIHSVSMGKRAVGVTSGKAIDALSSRDSSQLEGTQARIEEAVKHMAKSVLMLMGKFYDESKMLRMLDETGRVTFKAIKGIDLVTDPEVSIEAGSLFRFEAQDRDDKILGLLQFGLIPPEEALKELSFRTGNAFVSKKVQAMSHAADLLDAAKLGAEIEFFANDDLAAMEQVFSEFMQTADYYKLEEERQEYIRDALVAILAHGQPDEAYQQLRQAQTVFPRKPPAQPSMAAQSIMATESPGAQAQMVEEQRRLATKVGSLADAERKMTTRTEAGISPARSSGGV
jgi:hypothetical protein